MHRVAAAQRQGQHGSELGEAAAAHLAAAARCSQRLTHSVQVGGDLPVLWGPSRGGTVGARRTEAAHTHRPLSTSRPAAWLMLEVCVAHLRFAALIDAAGHAAAAARCALHHPSCECCVR